MGGGGKDGLGCWGAVVQEPEGQLGSQASQLEFSVSRAVMRRRPAGTCPENENFCHGPGYAPSVSTWSRLPAYPYREGALIGAWPVEGR